MNMPNQYLSPKRRSQYQRKKPKSTRRRSRYRGKDVDLALLINRSRMDYCAKPEVSLVLFIVL